MLIVLDGSPNDENSLSANIIPKTWDEYSIDVLAALNFLRPRMAILQNIFRNQLNHIYIYIDVKDLAEMK